MSARPLEYWAGPECTVNRVGDEWISQLELTGHGDRPGDLRLLADLGVSAVRYPVLWEQVCGRRVDTPYWEWADRRLQALRELGLRPIAGLVHHGSGPNWTSLVEPSFPGGLARHARAVAERYPWLRDFTPVNEPLTTARFAGLYGHWYPHGRDDATFLRALLGEVRGIVESMTAIREITPDARLVLTEDIGFTSSTPHLAYQAKLENERRWLSVDLLCGRVTPGDHPLWDWLAGTGIPIEQIEWHAEHPCPPDILGLNHYLSSQRFIDERVDRYPGEAVGGNGRDRYVDVLSTRTLADRVHGIDALLEQAWQRFGLPLAVTEVHNGSTREEQWRWLVDVHDGVLHARQRGVDVRAITAWAAFGSVGWDTLVTRRGGTYEPGLYDARCKPPRLTAVGRAFRAMAHGQPVTHHVRGPGWWKRRDRFWYTPLHADGATALPQGAVADGRPLLITGGSGTLGRALIAACTARGLPAVAPSSRELDVRDPRAIERALAELMPWAVMNAAGYVRVDDAECQREDCMTRNFGGAVQLAEACARHDIHLTTFSTDLVFDGTKATPYVEPDPVNPLNTYGRSKALAEQRVAQVHPKALVLRTAAFFGPDDAHNFVTVGLRRLARGGIVTAACNQVVSPTYVPDLADATLDLVVDGETGLWHLTNGEAVSWAQLLRRTASRAGVSAGRVRAVPGEQLGTPARRPARSALASERGQLLPSLDSAIERYVTQRRGNCVEQLNG